MSATLPEAPVPRRVPARPSAAARTATFVREIGGMAELAGLALRRGTRPPFDYAPELIAQLRFGLAIAWFPMILTAFALSFGPAGVQASNLLGLFGALDRLGGAYAIFVVRLIAPLVTAIVVAAAIGTSICADLGAREVREERAALTVMGVDPIKALVVPRLLAIVVLSVLFNVVALLAGLLGAIVVVLQNDTTLGAFFSSFYDNAVTLELAASFVKCAIYGAVIAIVCCYKGMNASGGAEGVGRAVNQSVVIAFLAIGSIDYVYSQLLLATNPSLSEVR